MIIIFSLEDEYYRGEGKDQPLWNINIQPLKTEAAAPLIMSIS